MYYSKLGREFWRNSCSISSNKSPTITIECPKAITVHGIMQIGPSYNQSGVSAGGMGILYYSDDGTTYTEVSNNIASKYERRWVATSGDNTSVKDWIKIASEGFGTHKYWRMLINRATEFLGLNQIIFY